MSVSQLMKLILSVIQTQTTPLVVQSIWYTNMSVNVSTNRGENYLFQTCTVQITVHGYMVIQYHFEQQFGEFRFYSPHRKIHHMLQKLTTVKLTTTKFITLPKKN